MGKSVKSACLRSFGIILGLCFLSPELFCQEIQTRTIPNTLLRPERGETPRYPRDLVIGELGKGSASEEAYQFAKELLSVLIAGAVDAPALADTASSMTNDLIETIKSIEPRSYRLGGGRTEADGSVSFLVRILGNWESITGELFLRQQDAEEQDEVEDGKTETGEESGVDAGKEGKVAKELTWILDDLILEEKRALSEIRDSYRYDFSPYERFF